jgi:hypothetical protein
MGVKEKEEEDKKIVTKGERGTGWLELRGGKERLARPMLMLKIGRGDDLFSNRLGRSKHQRSDMLSLFTFFLHLPLSFLPFTLLL